MSAFALQDGTVHHTYSSYACGADAMISAYQLLDRAPHAPQERCSRGTSVTRRPGPARTLRQSQNKLTIDIVTDTDPDR
jgi:uncharacterized protein DUF899